MKQGILKRELFDELCQYEKKEKEAEFIWNYLLKFELAFKLEEDILFIPAVASQNTEVIM